MVLAGITEGRSADYPTSINKRQENALKLAFIEGTRVGYPETVQAIVWQESWAGEYHWTKYGIVGDKKGGMGKKSYGIGQVQIATAKHVLRVYPYLGNFKTDEHLLVALMTDDHFNISICAHYFKMQLDALKNPGAWGKAVLAYNAGLGNVLKHGRSFDPNNYPAKVWSHITNFIRPFNLGEISVK